LNIFLHEAKVKTVNFNFTSQWPQSASQLLLATAAATATETGTVTLKSMIA